MQTITYEELAEYILNYKVDLYRLAFSIVKNDADAQDAVGEAILKAYENIHKIKKKDSIKIWLMKILANSSKDIIKRRSRWKLLDNELDNVEDESSFEIDLMWPLIMELPQEFRMVVVLYYYEQFSVKEISRIVKVSEGTVKSRLARGREKLSKIIEK